MDDVIDLLKHAEDILVQVEKRCNELPEDWSVRITQAMFALRAKETDVLSSLISCILKCDPLLDCKLGTISGSGSARIERCGMLIDGRISTPRTVAYENLFYPVAMILLRKIKSVLQEANELNEVSESLKIICGTK